MSLHVVDSFSFVLVRKVSVYKLPCFLFIELFYSTSLRILFCCRYVFSSTYPSNGMAKNSCLSQI